MTRKPWKPGVYHGVPFAEYVAIDAWNHSTLRAGITHSMAHLHYAREFGTYEPSDAMRLGSGLHAWLLERDRYADLVAIAPDVNMRTIAGKAEYAEFEKAVAGRTVLDKAEESIVKAMAASIGKHPRARKLAATPGKVETVVVWTDEHTGLMCKARIDKMIVEASIGVDIKSTRDASRDKFCRSVVDYGYHTQLAFYADGWKAATDTEMNFYIVAVENDAPHACAVYELDDESQDIGRTQMRSVLESVAASLASGEWPGYSDTVQPIGLPEWEKRKFSMQLGGDA